MIGRSRRGVTLEPTIVGLLWLLGSVMVERRLVEGELVHDHREVVQVAVGLQLRP